MKKMVSMLKIVVLILFLSMSLFSQKEVVIKLKDGVSHIPIAIPVFMTNNSSKKNIKLRDDIHKTLWDNYHSYHDCSSYRAVK